ncbi:MAG: GGDEF domain-containing protein [Syntrophaceae bacterium]|nr:GGDEF domain-containing protein [Syntrophaceae bacterium]
MKAKQQRPPARRSRRKTGKSAAPNPAFNMMQEERDFARWLSKDIAVLDYFAGATEKVPRELWITLETLRVNKGSSLYVELLYALTHKYFPPKEARMLWDAVVRHKQEVSSALDRQVSMRVAALDYFDQSAAGGALQLLPEEDLDSLLLYANKDGLTGVHNHRFFQERLRYEIVRSKRYHHVFTLLFIDLDHFKKFNDTHGHLKGDILIRDIATFLNLSCRQADVVARYGGDEFAIILPETNSRSAYILAGRLCQTFHTHRFGTKPFVFPAEISLSIGVSTYPKDGHYAEELIDSADSALYRAKKAGRHCICHRQHVFRPSKKPL